MRYIGTFGVRGVGLAAGVAAAATIASCAANSGGHYRSRLANTGKSALHAVQNQRLREIMGNLNRHIPEEWGPTMEREQQMREMAKVAGEMARTAGDIPTVLQGVNLPEAERQLFVGLAEKLRTQATELQQQAEKKLIYQVENSLDAIVGTCNACHSAFRILPPAGPKS